MKNRYTVTKEQNLIILLTLAFHLIGSRYMRINGTCPSDPYVTESSRYRAQCCEGCPLRCMCYKGKGNRRVAERNHRLVELKRKAAGLLTSEEGIKRRGRRCIEPEAVFGQMKVDMNYKRFRHFGKDKVTMDFAFLAMAFNLKKMCKKAV